MVSWISRVDQHCLGNSHGGRHGCGAVVDEASGHSQRREMTTFIATSLSCIHLDRYTQIQRRGTATDNMRSRCVHKIYILQTDRQNIPGTHTHAQQHTTWTMIVPIHEWHCVYRAHVQVMIETKGALVWSIRTRFTFVFTAPTASLRFLKQSAELHRNIWQKFDSKFRYSLGICRMYAHWTAFPIQK